MARRKYKAEIALKVITPLIISSGNVREKEIPEKDSNGKSITYQAKVKTAELRVPSIKGVMRWWFRAMMGMDDTNKLKELEDNVFGSTEKRSKINIRIEHEPFNPEQWKHSFKDAYNCLKEEGRKYRLNGFQYLSYTNYVKTTKKKQIDIREYISPCSTFDLIITSLDKESFESAMISLWFALNLGGFGNRARRGFGKLQAERVRISPEPDSDSILNNFIFCYGQELESQKEIIKKGVAGWKQYRTIENLPNTNTTNYTNIVNARLFILDKRAEYDCSKGLDNIPFTEWELALNEAGKRFQHFRQNYLHDKKEILKRDRIDITKLKKPVFGLPIEYRFRNNYRTKIKHKDTVPFGDRFASPVWISIHKIGEYYYPAFLFMFSNPAQGMDLVANNMHGKFNQNNSVFDEFIDSELKGITFIEFTI